MSRSFNTIDVSLETRLGRIPNQRLITIVGHSEALTTSERTIMPGTGSIDPSAIIATPAVVKVASTSANDTSAGTGARTIVLYGLSSAGVEQSETITLNGQTEVTSSLTYKFILSMTVVTAGSGGVNAGTLWCGTGVFTTGVPATKLCAMEAGTNQAALGAYMVPAGYTFVPLQITTYLGDASSGRFVESNLYIRDVNTGLYSQVFSYHLPAGGIPALTPAFRAQPAGTVIELRGLVSTGSAAVTVAMPGYLVLDA